MTDWFFNFLALLIGIYLLVIGCAHQQIDTSRHWTKEDVVYWLEGARDSHIKNRGVHNSKTFDDQCVQDYNSIIQWIKENYED